MTEDKQTYCVGICSLIIKVSLSDYLCYPSAVIVLCYYLVCLLDLKHFWAVILSFEMPVLGTRLRQTTLHDVRG